MPQVRQNAGPVYAHTGSDPRLRPKGNQRSNKVAEHSISATRPENG